jgi:hypothetical protein
MQPIHFLPTKYFHRLVQQFPSPFSSGTSFTLTIRMLTLFGQFLAQFKCLVSISANGSQFPTNPHKIVHTNISSKNLI